MKNIYILTLLFLLFNCENSKTNTEISQDDNVLYNTIELSKAQFESQNMKLGKIEKHSFKNTIKTSGFLDVPPQNKASVSSFFEGYVKRTPLLIGDEVKKGQLVVSLENPSYVEIQQNYLEVLEQLTYLKSEFERQKTLFEENITSQKNYLKAQSTYKSNLAHHNGLKQKLKMMNINPESVEKGIITSTINLYAPISGSVSKVNVSNGTFVSASSQIIEIINTDHTHLELSVFEKDVLDIKKGQLIEFTIPESSATVFKAEVHLVGTSIDETNRTIKVHGHINDENQSHLIMGMFIEANIITEDIISFALPKHAVITSDNSSYALALKNQVNENFSFEKVNLETGKETENYIEILNADELKDYKFLINGAFMLLSE
jgi:cobalt-zinc-cadmium efflux system membrane fusion protein